MENRTGSGKRGLRVGKQRVQRLMQEYGIRARGTRRFRDVLDAAHARARQVHLDQRLFDR